jgi:hypothetical protein
MKSQNCVAIVNEMLEVKEVSGGFMEKFNINFCELIQ